MKGIQQYHWNRSLGKIIKLKPFSIYIKINKFKKDSKISRWSLNERKPKELATLLNGFVNHQTEDFLYLHCYLALIDHAKTRQFVNKQHTPN